MENYNENEQISFTNMFKFIANKIRIIGTIIGTILIIIGIIKYCGTLGYYGFYGTDLYNELCSSLVEIKSLLSLIVVAVGTLIDVLSLKH